MYHGLDVSTVTGHGAAEGWKNQYEAKIRMYELVCFLHSIPSISSYIRVATMKMVATLDCKLCRQLKSQTRRDMLKTEASLCKKIVRKELKVIGATCIHVVTYLAKTRHDMKARSAWPPRPKPWVQMSRRPSKKHARRLTTSQHMSMALAALKDKVPKPSVI
jgi:hypothetical protein